MHSLEEIRKTYRNYPDSKLRRIAQTDSKSLRPEVIPILIEEMINRNYEEELILWVQVENRKLTPSEFSDLVTKVIDSTCSFCKTNTGLRGYQFETVIAFFIGVSMSSHNLIVCKTCGRKKIRKSFFISLFFGWISVGALLYFPFLIYNKCKEIVQRKRLSTTVIHDFIHNNIGLITIGDDSTKIIQHLLDEHNHKEDNSEV